MTEAAALLLPDGRAIGTAPVTCDLPAGGLVLRLTLPAGRSLAAAALSLAAPPLPATPREFTDAALLSNLDAFPAGGDTVGWLRATWPQERAVTAIRLIGATTAAARLRAFSRGAWRPLTPPETVALAADAKARPVVLTPLAASGIMAEFLAPFTPAANAPAVFLPAPCKVGGMAVFGTDQPCHVGVAAGADPAFFTREGPLPAEPVEAQGLLRAATRYLAEHAGATEVPLRIAADGPARIVLQGFAAALQPPAAGTDGATGPDPGPPPETLFPPDVMPVASAAQLCDPAHWVAQRLDPPAGGATIASLGLYLATGAAPPAGRVTLHGGADRPEPEPLGGLPDAPLSAPDGAGPGWATCRPATPWRTDGPAWVVCRLTAGEAFWFTAPARPAQVGPVLTSSGGGPWVPAAAAGPRGWAQLRLGLVPGG